jgi:D-sedoheptulose 7-phosphate isomerase
MNKNHKIKIIKSIEENIFVKKKIIHDVNIISLITNKIYNCLNKKGKIFICGNGGSASDAQHLAAEFMVRLRPSVNRRPYPVVALTLDPATMTACSNDYGYSKIYSRPLSALATTRDILIVLSTSGNSKNIIEVLKLAKKKKIFSIGFLGSKGGKSKSLCDLKYIVPSDNVARIQEAHIFLGHTIFEIIEDMLIKSNINEN